MNTQLLARLEKSIQEFVDKNCEDADNWPNEGVTSPQLVAQMTTAAAAVFDANFAGQAYAKQEGYC